MVKKKTTNWVVVLGQCHETKGDPARCCSSAIPGKGKFEMIELPDKVSKDAWNLGIENFKVDVCEPWSSKLEYMKDRHYQMLGIGKKALLPNFECNQISPNFKVALYIVQLWDVSNWFQLNLFDRIISNPRFSVCWAARACCTPEEIRIQEGYQLHQDHGGRNQEIEMSNEWRKIPE